VDFEAEGFYEGLEGEARAEREELLGWLSESGYSDEALRRAHRLGLLAFLPAEREVGGEAKYTLEEVAREAGVDAGLLAKLRRANGLPPWEPDARELTDVDLEGARIARRFDDLGLSEDQMVSTTRVLGRGLARSAEAMRAMMLEVVLEPGTTERQLAERYGAGVHAVMPMVGPMVLQMLSQHLRNMVQTEVAGATERATGRPPGARDMSIAFADLVGFTRLGEEIAPEDLGRIAERLEEVAGEVVSAPVRIVKTIGDAVMFAAPEPGPLVQTALALVEQSDRHAAEQEFPQVRVGVAHGPAVVRGGDVFGRAVNLASRVTSIARAGSVLATRDVRDAAREEFQWSSARARRIKGLPEPVPLYRARPLPAEGS